MSERGIRLPFKLLGVPVLLDYSFLLILPLFAYLIGSQLGTYAQVLAAAGVHIDPSGLQQGVTRWVLGAAGAIGLFVSVLVHELGHAVTARLYGAKTLDIRLWFLGGVARLDEMPRGRGAEAVVAIAGPLTSFLIGVLLWVVLPQVTQYPGPALVISYLAITNVALAIFNMLPALPLDGGRILRGVLELFMPHLRATSVAAFVSAVVAILLGLYGFFSREVVGTGSGLDALADQFGAFHLHRVRGVRKALAGNACDNDRDIGRYIVGDFTPKAYQFHVEATQFRPDPHVQIAAFLWLELRVSDSEPAPIRHPIQIIVVQFIQKESLGVRQPERGTQ